MPLACTADMMVTKRQNSTNSARSIMPSPLSSKIAPNCAQCSRRMANLASPRRLAGASAIAASASSQMMG